MDLDINNLNPEQIEKLRHSINRLDQQKAQQASFDRLNYCNALYPIVTSNAYDVLIELLTEVAQHNNDDGFFKAHVDMVIPILARLKQQTIYFNDNTKPSLEQQRAIIEHEAKTE